MQRYKLALQKKYSGQKKDVTWKDEFWLEKMNSEIFGMQ